MNYVSFSPHFPPNYVPFCVQLQRQGVTVLGLADEAYDCLPPALRAALREYYRVNNPNRYDELLRALGYFTHKYGKLDRLESHNEFWLESDARLRTDFNIPGLRSADMEAMKRKSAMKARFTQAGIRVARGRLAATQAEGLALIEETGFPVVAKPDSGVGANKTYKLTSREELEAFFRDKPPVEYFLEEFVNGTIVTFDGLVDQDGRIVFSSSMQYSDGVMDMVNLGQDFWYWMVREIPADLAAAGQRLVDVYGLRERFFHFEFFRQADGGLVGLEVNMRPPGGLTTDMWNYANDMDIYCEYANVVVSNRFVGPAERPYFCAYVGRRRNKAYRRTPEEARAAFPKNIVHHEPISGIFASAIGDYGILVRTPEEAEMFAIVNWLLEKA